MIKRCGVCKSSKLGGLLPKLELDERCFVRRSGIFASLGSRFAYCLPPGVVEDIHCLQGLVIASPLIALPSAVRPDTVNTKLFLAL